MGPIIINKISVIFSAISFLGVEYSVLNFVDVFALVIEGQFVHDAATLPILHVLFHVDATYHTFPISSSA